MIPEEPRDFHGSGGERKLFRALRTLPEDVVVLHSFRWLHPGNAKALARDIGAQGEGDFVILDPAHGILVVEVKGGKVWCEHGQWFQENRKTHRVEPINPEAQASNALYRLMPDVTDTVKEARSLIFGHAVWFPDGSIDGARLPLNYHRNMTFDCDDIAEPEKAIGRAFAYWSDALERKPKRLNAEDADRVLKALAPSCDIVRTVRQTLDEREEQLVQLTAEQARIVHFLDEQLHAAVHGAAGTGKTLVAVEKARRIASPAHPVLFLCFNSALQAHLETNHPHANVRYLTFHGLARELVGPGASADDEERRLLEYLDENRPIPYDHLVVDEAQDFEHDWLEYLHLHFRQGAFYAFYDRNQTVQGDRKAEWLNDFPCRLALTRNCRNADPVARLAYRAAGLVPGLTLGVEGPRPTLHIVANEQAALARVVALVDAAVKKHKRPPSDIAVLTLGSLKEENVWSTSRFGSLPTAHRPTNGAVTLTTCRRFKGLEAALIVVVDVDFTQAADIEWRRLLYIASSRARLAVHLISTNEEDEIGAAVGIFADSTRVRPGWRALCRSLGVRMAEGENYDPFD